MLGVAAIVIAGHSCIKVNGSLGENLIPTDQQFDLHTAEFPLTDIQMKMADDLSGFSRSRITIGAIRDDQFGLTTRGCALTLVPLHDTIDFGKNPKFKRFHFSALRDTVSVADAGQERILQNVNVYELVEAPDFKKYDLNTIPAHGMTRITKGIPVLNGANDSLSFDFTEEFARKFFEMKDSDLDSLKGYLAKFPGIYIETDAPTALGGRINMFNVQLGYSKTQGYLDNTYAELYYSAEYDGVVKDTAMFFYYSPTKVFKVDSLLTNGTSGKYPQYCFNATGHETRPAAGKATDKILIEGGGGLKPVILAADLKKAVEAAIAPYGDPRKAIINRARIILPFDEPDDYTAFEHFPDFLNPTGRIESSNGYVSYASLTDTSSENEDPGKLNRSICRYAPDITYQMQSILKIDDEKELSNYDIWFLLMHTEVEVTENNNSSSMTDMYNYLAYSSYYNNMYGGYGYGGYGYGYGGYGNGYGGYGDYYSNYYNYALMASMFSNNSTSTKSTVELDTDRYYKAVLRGPDAKDGPKISLTFSLPKE